MTDIERILAEELPPPAVRESPAPYNASEVIAGNRPRSPLPEKFVASQFQPGVSGNPSGVGVLQSKATLTRALREAMTIKQAQTLANAAIEQAEAGNLRALEFIRDSLEGKPGVRIADGEWNPETAQTFNIMARYAQVIADGSDITASVPGETGTRTGELDDNGTPEEG